MIKTKLAIGVYLWICWWYIVMKICYIFFVTIKNLNLTKNDMDVENDTQYNQRERDQMIHKIGGSESKGCESGCTS